MNSMARVLMKAKMDDLLARNLRVCLMMRWVRVNQDLVITHTHKLTNQLQAVCLECDLKVYLSKNRMLVLAHTKLSVILTDQRCNQFRKENLKRNVELSEHLKDQR